YALLAKLATLCFHTLSTWFIHTLPTGKQASFSDEFELFPFLDLRYRFERLRRSLRARELLQKHVDIFFERTAAAELSLALEPQRFLLPFGHFFQRLEEISERRRQFFLERVDIHGRFCKRTLPQKKRERLVRTADAARSLRRIFLNARRLRHTRNLAERFVHR